MEFDLGSSVREEMIFLSETCIYDHNVPSAHNLPYSADHGDSIIS